MEKAVYKLALVQASATAEPARNFATLQRMAEQSHQHGCQAVCFPEAFLTGYYLDTLEQHSLTLSSVWLTKVSKLAQLERLDLIVGFLEKQKERYYLSQGIFRWDGTRDIYHKTHLGLREARVLTAGDTVPVYRLSNGLTVGISLCVENHFPELLQTLSLQGAEVVFAPHAVPRKAGNRKQLWSRYIPTRSYDNRIYLACCNQWDEDKFGGGCLVTTPEGEVLDSYFGEQEYLLTFSVNRAALKKYHQESSMKYRYYPAMRKPWLYKEPYKQFIIKNSSQD